MYYTPVNAKTFFCDNLTEVILCLAFNLKTLVSLMFIVITPFCDLVTREINVVVSSIAPDTELQTVNCHLSLSIINDHYL